MLPQLTCPYCGNSTSPRENSGRPECPDCGRLLPQAPSGLGLPGEGRTSASSASALDEPASRRAPTSGAITMLRKELQSDEDQQGGWIGKLFSRREVLPIKRESSSACQVDPGHPKSAIGPRPSSVPPRPAGFSPRPASRPEEGTDTPPLHRDNATGGPASSRGNRLPLAGILAGLVFCTISAVALLRGKETWPRGLFLATYFLLLMSLLGILHRHGSRRAFWQGFALFGWGYLVLAFTPWNATRIEPELPTTELLGYLHSQLVASAEGDHPSISPSTNPRLARSLSPKVDSGGLKGGSERGFSTLDIVGSHDQFLIVGHCLITLMASLLGAGTALWFHKSAVAGLS